jgi:hypothetical protein
MNERVVARLAAISQCVDELARIREAFIAHPDEKIMIQVRVSVGLERAPLLPDKELEAKRNVNT